MKKRSVFAPFLIIIAVIAKIPKSYGFDETIYADSEAAVELYQKYNDGLTKTPSPPDSVDYNTISFLENSKNGSVGRLVMTGTDVSMVGSAFAAGSGLTALTACHNTYKVNTYDFLEVIYHRFGAGALECNYVVNWGYVLQDKESNVPDDFAVLYAKDKSSFVNSLSSPLSLSFVDVSQRRYLQSKSHHKYMVGYPSRAYFRYALEDGWYRKFVEIADWNSQKLLNLSERASSSFTSRISPYFMGHPEGPSTLSEFTFTNLNTGPGQSGSPLLFGKLPLDGPSGWMNEVKQITYAPGVFQGGLDGAALLPDGKLPPIHDAALTDEAMKACFSADYRMQTLMINTALQIMRKQHTISDFPTPSSLSSPLETPPIPIEYYEAASKLGDDMGIERIPINKRIPAYTPTLLATITLGFAKKDQTDYKDTMPGVILPWLVWRVDEIEYLGQEDVKLELKFKSYDVIYEEDVFYTNTAAPGSGQFDMTEFYGTTGRYRALDAEDLGRPFQIWITSKRPIEIRDPLLLKHIERAY